MTVPNYLDELEETEEGIGTPSPSANGKHKRVSFDRDAGDCRPKLDTGCKDLSVITPQAIKHLAAMNDPPRLFRYGSLPSRLERDDSEAPLIRTLTYERTRHEMARAILFTEWKKSGQDTVEVATVPPKDVVLDALATPELPLPVLRRIVECPVFAADGTLHEMPGYSPESMTYYEPSAGFECPPVPDRPTPKEIADAAGLLWVDLLGDFPFTGDAEKAHAVAVFLLPFVRDLVGGPTPLHLIEKPSPGTGATLLVDGLIFPATGRPVPAMTEGRDEDEWRKRIFAKLRASPVVVNLDNLRRRLDSAALSSALTAYPTWEDRVLGYSETARVPVTCVWLATGNNPALSHEMTRRTVRIRLDAKTDRPWLRTGFRHPDLKGWVVANRGRLVHAALVLVRAWIAAGKPAGKITLGMYESWSHVLGGILNVAGIEGFLCNLEELYENADTETAGLRAFVAAWWDRFRSVEQGVKDLRPLAVDDNLLSLGDGKEQAQQTRLGFLLRANRDRMFTVEIGEGEHAKSIRLRLEKGGMRKRAVLWKLTEVRPMGEDTRLDEVSP